MVCGPWRKARSPLRRRRPYLVAEQLAEPGEHGGEQPVSARGRHKAGGPGALPAETVASSALPSPPTVWGTSSQQGRPQKEPGCSPKSGVSCGSLHSAMSPPDTRHRHSRKPGDQGLPAPHPGAWRRGLLHTGPTQSTRLSPGTSQLYLSGGAKLEAAIRF